jgi:hypothetical protein
MTRRMAAYCIRSLKTCHQTKLSASTHSLSPIIHNDTIITKGTVSEGYSAYAIRLKRHVKMMPMCGSNVDETRFGELVYRNR